MVSTASKTVTIPETTTEETTGSGNDLEARVIVFNCNCHTYQQVIELFCRIIPGMNPSKAFELAWCIDHRGSASVYSGDRNSVEGIGTQLANGGLRVAIQ